MSALFACANCSERFIFEELSDNEHLCKNCQKLKSNCSYCRSEFQLESKHSKESICKKCAHYVEKYGVPSACKYCKLIAAFLGSKCERCYVREKKFGAPKLCEQCQQKSAFPKSDKLLENKSMCWLCARSYKKLILTSSIPRKKQAHEHHIHKHKIKKLKQSLTQQNQNHTSINTSSQIQNNANPVELKNSDHFVMVNKLQEEIDLLKKIIQEKDRLLLDKDKKMGSIKAMNFGSENDYRVKIQNLQKEHSESITLLQTKNRDLQKQISQLTMENNTVSKMIKKKVTAFQKQDSPYINSPATISPLFL
ncbi:protein FAM76B-like isoform X2 [Gordionus sp. m RMFG-2023]|uniref:protein FAM76B-like isoform X2 n=1 Tax=Gordionus sp. m RMFG-2023 TaxID=3053472 RepID=UPI0031FCB1D7